MIAQERRRKELSLSHPPKAKMEKPSGEYSDGEPVDPTQAAEYLGDLLEGAKELASKSGFTFLAYLIQVAVEEARIQAAASKEHPY
jgi:hypothetical protein